MRLPTLAALTVALGLSFAAPALADGNLYTVVGTDDVSGECTGTAPSFTCPSLRAAVTAANADTAGDEIVLGSGLYTLDQSLDIGANDLVIFGGGARDTTLQARGAHRVLTVAAQGSLAAYGLTITGGSDGDRGGNILNQGSLFLWDSRVTGGTAPSAGGIANDGDLDLELGLVDHNTGGGIASTTAGSTLNLLDATVAANTGYGISASGDGTSAFLYQATVARNSGAGLLLDSLVNSGMYGSIVAANGGASCTTQLADGGDSGANVASDDSCGLTDPSSKPNTDPLLSASLVNAGGQTDVLTIPATSPAVDIVANCFGIDQRGFDRGSPCDAGAYEQSAAVPTIITGGPSGPTTSTSLSFTFASSSGNTFECALTGPGRADDFAACTSPWNYTGLTPGSYVFTVRTLDDAGRPTGQEDSRSFTVVTPQPTVTPTPTPTPSPTATPTLTPTPVPGQTVVAKPVKGTIKIKLPGTNTFVDLDGTQGIPVGATVDTRHGTVQLTALQKPGGKTETAIFFDGLFKLTQTKTTTDLTLNEPLAPCARRGRAASTAAKKKPKTRGLWGDGHGSFRTKGQYSAATVRGTKWFVQDSCAGTLTRVAQGVVSVRDNVRHKTIVLRAGKKYLARPRR